MFSLLLFSWDSEPTLVCSEKKEVLGSRMALMLAHTKCRRRNGAPERRRDLGSSASAISHRAEGPQ